MTRRRECAEDGTLTVVAGGEAAALADVNDVLSAMASEIHHVGQHGSGQLVKLANNVIGFGTVLAVCERFALIAAAGDQGER